MASLLLMLRVNPTDPGRCRQLRHLHLGADGLRQQLGRRLRARSAGVRTTRTTTTTSTEAAWTSHQGAVTKRRLCAA